MEGIMNEESDWDHDVEGDAVEGAVCCVSRDEVVQVLSEMKSEKASQPSDVSLVLNAASNEVKIYVMVELCLRE